LQTITISGVEKNICSERFHFKSRDIRQNSWDAKISQ